MEITPTAKIERFKTLEEVDFLYVDDEEKLEEMCEHLNSPDVKEIAIDLEAHSARSYQGFLCLM